MADAFASRTSPPAASLGLWAPIPTSPRISSGPRRPARLPPITISTVRACAAAGCSKALPPTSPPRPCRARSWNTTHPTATGATRRPGSAPRRICWSTDERGIGVVQLKSVEPSVYARNWENGEPPFWIALQALTEAKLTGAQWAAVGALRIGHGVDFDLVPVPLHAGAWQALLDAVGAFWRASRPTRRRFPTMPATAPSSRRCTRRTTAPPSTCPATTN